MVGAPADAGPVRDHGRHPLRDAPARVGAVATGTTGQAGCADRAGGGARTRRFRRDAEALPGGLEGHRPVERAGGDRLDAAGDRRLLSAGARHDVGAPGALRRAGREARAAGGSSIAGEAAGRGGERARKGGRGGLGGSDLRRGHAEVRLGRRRVRAAAAPVHWSGLVAALERRTGGSGGNARSEGRAFVRVPARGAVSGRGPGAARPAAPRAEALADPGRRSVRAAPEGAPEGRQGLGAPDRRERDQRDDRLEDSELQRQAARALRREDVRRVRDPARGLLVPARDPGLWLRGRNAARGGLRVLRLGEGAARLVQGDDRVVLVLVRHQRRLASHAVRGRQDRPTPIPRAAAPRPPRSSAS